MLAKADKLFGDALRSDYALGAFNVSNLELAQAVVAGAVAKKSPVIVQTSEGAIEYAGLKVLAAMVKVLAEDVPVPVVLHLDHGQDVELLKRCIEAGYTSVMIDASKETFADNMRIVKEVAAYAHERGVWVEAELGAILGKEGVKDLQGERTPESYFTKPEQAQEFVETTGVDALAVSVGTIHGAFSGQEYIRFELLENIQQVVPHLPLVLHGASGIADTHLRQAVATHVCKVNVDTELRIAFEAAAQAYFGESHEFVDPRKMLGPAREAVQKVVEKKIDLFGSGGMSAVY